MERGGDGTHTHSGGVAAAAAAAAAAVADQSNNVLGGGKSRAAKKRAKKKKKKAGNGNLVTCTTTATIAADKSCQEDPLQRAHKRHDGGDDDDRRTDEKKHAEPSMIKKKKKKKQKIATNAHDGSVINNDDDSIGVKQPKAGTQSTVVSKSSLEPSHNNHAGSDTVELDNLTSLVNDILLVDDDEDNGDSKSSSPSSPLAQKTAQERAKLALAFLLAPSGVSVDEFYRDYWEKKPLYVKAKGSSFSRFDGLLSLASIQKTLEETPLYLGKDLNVTRYQETEDGVKRRKTFDQDLKAEQASKEQHSRSKKYEENDDSSIPADPKVVWKHYQQGCSIRLLCPHERHFSNNIHALLSLLELEWGCMVGANAYLTPPQASQGFAPHYDDIEAFCLQLEGKKNWKVYAPLNKAERLPRTSSPDYTEEELLQQNAEMVLDVVLSRGDLLYMPRGWIHQACTLPSSNDAKKRKRATNKGNSNDDQHSLHLTVSAMQHWSWVDLMEVLLPEALEAATNSESSIALRQGLPRQFLSYMGAAYDGRDCSEPLRQLHKRLEGQEAESSAAETPADTNGGHSVSSRATTAAEMEQLQEEFRAEAKKRIMRVAKEAMDMVDASCDQIAKQFLSSCQPPALTRREVQATSRRQGQGAGDDDHQMRLKPDDSVRLVRPGVARLVVEDGMAVLYHCLDNSRVYHETPISPMEFELDDAAAMEQLLVTTEPNWICIADLFHDSIQEKLGVAQSLYDEGILVLRRQYETQRDPNQV